MMIVSIFFLIPILFDNDCFNSLIALGVEF